MATTGLLPTTRMSSGVMSDPPPIPVRPMSTPTPSPKTITSGSNMQAALRLVAAGPAAVAAVARLGARRAADRGVAAVVQRVTGQVALVDAPPQVLLRPRRQRVHLPDATLVVALDLLSVGARGRLLAADPGDPGVRILKRPVQGRDLQLAAALFRAGPGAGGLLHLDAHAEALLERLPRRQRLREEH